MGARMSGVEGLETERLEAEITTLAGHIAAATCRWLLLVAEFDRRQAWAGWGCKSCAHWLSWQCAMGLRAAREHVRVARALSGLPAIRSAFAAGRLSYSQARALTRVAEPDREEELLELARHATGAQLEQFVRGYVKATALRDEARDAYERRELVWWHDDDGSLVIHARLPADDGAVVLEALQATADRLRDAERRADADEPAAAPGTADECSAEHSVAHRPPPRALLADALTELARGAADGDAPSDSYQVVVNVDLETLAADAPGSCRLPCGTVLAPETARRLACDQQVVALHHVDGHARGSARRARFSSARLNRLLDRRDGGCRFPGCTHTRHLHTHHIIHWAHGGSTSAENLVRLCSHHHRLVHEGGYAISGNPAGELIFRRPDGRRIGERPARRGGCAGAVTELNRRRGVHPGPTTITPTWDGERLDVDWAVDMLANSS
jgi:hypothetical protein